MCGSKIETQNETVEAEVVNEEKVETNQAAEEKPARVWFVFSTLSKVFGIIALATFWMAFAYCSFGPAAIVFGILGKKSKDPDSIKSCELGIKLGIIGTALSLVAFIVYTVLTALGVITIANEDFDFFY